MRKYEVLGWSNTEQAMRGKLRKWMVDNPRGMTAAYALTTVGTYALIGTNAAGGAATGP